MSEKELLVSIEAENRYSNSYLLFLLYTFMSFDLKIPIDELIYNQNQEPNTTGNILLMVDSK